MRDVDWSPRQYGFLFAINRPPLAAASKARKNRPCPHRPLREVLISSSICEDLFRVQQFVQCFYLVGSEAEANPRLQKSAVGFAQPH